MKYDLPLPVLSFLLGLLVGLSLWALTDLATIRYMW